MKSPRGRVEDRRRVPPRGSRISWSADRQRRVREASGAVERPLATGRLKWSRSQPAPQVGTLEKLLELVDEDERACFFG